MSVTDRRDRVRALVHAATRLGNTLHALDDMRAVGVVLENDVEGLFDLLAFSFRSQ